MESTQLSEARGQQRLGQPPGDGNGTQSGNGHGHDEIDLNVPKPRPVWVVLLAVVAVAALAALLVTGLLPRHQNQEQLNAEAAEAMNAPVQVNVVRPKRSPETVQITLPGTLRPWQEVSLFSRTTGYLKKYYVDISNPVEAGQLMAEIDSPEVDQELLQAQAALTQSRAAVAKATTDRDLAQVTLNRFNTLKGTNSVSQQDLDEKQAALNAAQANLGAAQANVTAAEANVQRLTEMKQFEHVVAPFGGVVTGRAYDNGSLITANPTATDIKPMFKIAENDVLRAFVNVPQSSALSIRKGMEVKVTARERPGRVFVGKVMGTTNYLDPANRSLLTEVKVPNVKEADGEFALLPGMFIEASFAVTRPAPPLSVPGPAIVSNAEGTQVAVVRDGAVHFVKVTLGKDYGTDVEVVEGLTGDEQVITNPGERVSEGVAVRTSGDEPPGPPRGMAGAEPKERVSQLPQK
jgi:RND family efflux transporter MFP subunit